MTENYWPDDALERKMDGEFLERFLVSRLAEQGGSFVLNIDAGWGRGKSYFLRCLGNQLEGSGHLVARVDAWATDHADDPLLAVMAAIEDCLKPYTRKRKVKRVLAAVKQNVGAITIAGLKGAIKGVTRRYAGESSDEIADLIQSDAVVQNDEKSPSRSLETDISKSITDEIESVADRIARAAIDHFRKTEESIKSFKENMSSLIQSAQAAGIKLPLFILIDELDRCRPTYAIEMLERAKHLFEIDNVVFVIATDTAQMRESIKAVYGAGFDSAKYLHRFFNRTYVFEDPKFEQFLELLRKTKPINEDKISVPDRWISINKTILLGLSGFGLSLRDFEQCYDHLHTIQSMWDRPYKIELIVILPLIVANHLGYPLEYTSSTFQPLKAALGPSAPHFNIPSGYQNTHMNAVTAMIEMAQMAQQGWRVADPHSENNQFRYWVGEQLRAEVRARPEMKESKKLSSSILDYPGLVRMAGRIKDR